MSAASFDSNIVIDALNGRSAAWAELERVGERWISRVTVIEVMSRVDRRALDSTRTMLDSFYIDEVSVAIAERAAALRRERPRLKLPDAVIHASALQGNRVLVTRNTKDFPAGLLGIRVPYSVA